MAAAAAGPGGRRGRLATRAGPVGDSSWAGWRLDLGRADRRHIVSQHPTPLPPSSPMTALPFHPQGGSALLSTGLPHFRRGTALLHKSDPGPREAHTHTHTQPHKATALFRNKSAPPHKSDPGPHKCRATSTK